MMGQASRHVYISADMEGITGLVNAQDVQPGGTDYERGRVMMTEDVNAAVGGALGVLSHSFMGHEIDARTVEVSGQLPDLYRLLGVFLRVATALTNQAPYC